VTRTCRTLITGCWWPWPSRRRAAGGLSDLASLVDFSQSRLTHALKRMESYGWVRRAPRPDNGREKDAVLTAAGRAALAAATPGHVALVRELMFDHLSAAQLPNEG
jgi:DNA-binding MarR family transcriptional regulator